MTAPELTDPLNDLAFLEEPELNMELVYSVNDALRNSVRSFELSLFLVFSFLLQFLLLFRFALSFLLLFGLVAFQSLWRVND
jgi:hypothetical protein